MRSSREIFGRDIAGPPEAVPEQDGDGRDEQGPDDEGVEQYADADHDADLGESDRREQAEHGEDGGEQDTGASDDTAGDGQGVKHPVPRSPGGRFLAGSGDEEDVVV